MSKFCKGSFKNPFRSLTLTHITRFVILTFSYEQYAFAETREVQFNNEFLRSDVDISAYSQGNPVPEGRYNVELYVNDKWKGRTDVTFKNNKPGARIAEPCITLKILSLAGIDIEKIPIQQQKELNEDSSCIHLEDISSELKADYDFSLQRISVQAPQKWLLRRARGYVSPELWDNGIAAATLQYDYNAWRTERSGSGQFSTQYLGLRGGLNWDAWRLRYRGIFNWSNDNGWHYSPANIYIERGIASIRSKLLIGESSTDGQVFDSVGFSGVMLTSDNRMYQDSLRGYAPVITGVANTNALVSITQRGVRIYETTVPPGPF